MSVPDCACACTPCSVGELFHPDGDVPSARDVSHPEKEELLTSARTMGLSFKQCSRKQPSAFGTPKKLQKDLEPRNHLGAVYKLIQMGASRGVQGSIRNDTLNTNFGHPTNNSHINRKGLVPCFRTDVHSLYM